MDRARPGAHVVVKVWLAVVTVALAAAGGVAYWQYLELEELRTEVAVARDEARETQELMARAIGEVVGERLEEIRSDVRRLEVSLPEAVDRVDELEGQLVDLTDCVNSVIDGVTGPAGRLIYYC